MTDFDYSAAAEFFPSKGRAPAPRLRYQRFATAAEALRYAVEDMPVSLLRGSTMEVNEQRFDGEQIRTLYDADDYPLARAEAA